MVLLLCRQSIALIVRQFYVYILSSTSRQLYVGVTKNLERRLYEHRNNFVRFTARYHITRLVYFESIRHPMTAIYREKEIKGWLRAKKIELIESANPAWDDLAADWFEPPPADGE